MVTRISRLFIALMAMFALLVPSLAFAEEASSDGVFFNLASDKQEYDVGDTATFSLQIANNSSEEMSAVEYSLELPPGMEALNLLQLSQNVGSVASGETKNFEIKANVTEQPIADADDFPDSSEDGQQDSGELAKTGDTSGIVFILMGLAIAGAGVAIVIGVKGRHTTLSVLLAVGLAGSVSLAASPYAFADEVNKSLSVKQDISVVGKACSAYATLSYAVDSTDGSEEPEETISRGQWIAELLNAAEVDISTEASCPFTDIDGSEYRDAIATAYELGILPESDAEQFSPDDAATREFAAVTAVLVAGFENDQSSLQANDAADANYPSLMAVAVDVEIISLDADGNLKPQQSLERADGDMVLQAVKALLAPSSVEDIVKVEYQDDVVVIDDYESVSGEYVVDSSRYQLREGQKVVFSGNDSDLEGIAGEVVSLGQPSDSGSIDDPVAISFDQITDPYEVFESIEVVGTTQLVDLSQAELADGFSWDMIQSKASRASLGKFDLKYEKDGSAIKVSVSPSVDVNVKWSFASGLERCDFKVATDLEAEADITALKSSLSISMFKNPIKVPLGHGFFVGANFYLKAEATGEISAKASIESEIGTKYTKGHWSTYKDQTTEMSASLEAKGKVAVAPSATLLLASISIIDVAPEVGMQASGKTTLRDTGMVCNDLSANLYATLKVGAETDWMKLAGIGYSKDLWNKDNSPCKWRAHMEDGTLVDACTYGKDDPTNPGGSGGDESEASDFEYAVGDYIVDLPEEAGGGVGQGKIPEGEQPDGTIWEVKPDVGLSVNISIHDGVNGSDGISGAVCGHGVYITDYLGDDEEVVIPDTINGEKVVYVSLYLSSNQTVDVSGATGLKGLFVHNGGGVVFGSGSSLQDIGLQEGSYDSIDLSGQRAVTTLRVHHVTGVEELSISSDTIEFVTLSLTSLQRVDISNCSNLSSLNLGWSDNLVSLNCSGCALTELDISSLSALSELYCQNNSIADTSALESWLAEEGHSGAVNPQNI